MVAARSGATETPESHATCSYRTHDSFSQGSLSRGRQNRSGGPIFYRVYVFRWIAIALAALLLAAPAGAATLSQQDAAEKRLVRRINHVRANHDLKPMRVVTRLKRAATRHSNSMANHGYFRHELRHDGKWKPFGTWIRWFWPGPDYPSWSAGENLAWGAPGLGARKTVTLWMHSPGHRANLLNKDWNRIGVSIVHVVDPLGEYADFGEATIATADFGRRSR
jgi:uncharacterized protein YkwD